MKKISKKAPRVILLIETSRAFGRGVLRGIMRYSRLHGPWIFYREVGGRERALPRLKDWRADGMIIRDTTKRVHLLNIKVPVIFVGYMEDLSDIRPFIITNDVRIGQMAAEHFLERGFRHFGFCGFDDFFWSRRRLQSFKEAILDAGFKVHVYKQPKSPRERSWDSEQMLMAKWFRSIPKPLAVLACNDDRGLHVTEACKTAGLRVPEEVAIIGVDNDDLVCELADPPLSSVALNVERIGYEAAELLDGLMRGKKKKDQTITVQPTHIVIRQSTDILAVKDDEVIDALRYIREHAREPIQVNQVTAAVALSRRALQNRFQKVLNRTIFQEIQRTRMRAVAEILTETNLSISHIAKTLGYSDLAKLSRAFKHQMDMGPLAYRQTYGLK